MKEKMSFEEAFALLENTVSRMETGELTLEESLSAFEEAIALVKLCTAELNRAEQRVRMLTEAADGTVTDVPFAGADDAT